MKNNQIIILSEQLSVIYTDIELQKEPFLSELVKKLKVNLKRKSFRISSFTDKSSSINVIHKLIKIKKLNYHLYVLSLYEKSINSALLTNKELIFDQRIKLALDGSGFAFWDWDLISDTIYLSDQWKKNLGLEDHEIGSKPADWIARIYPSDNKKVKRALALHLEGKSEIFECDYRILHKNGSYKWFLTKGTAIRSSNGKPIRMAGMQIDITESKENELGLKKALDDLHFALASEKVLMEELDRKNKELVELSITDGLTGLYNHRFLQERFDFELKRVRRYGGSLSCIIIDIDHFKEVNDTHGHQFGDLVLRQIATILRTKSREVDICGRYGGEEFMIITNLSSEDAFKYAGKLHASIENHPFSDDTKTAHVTVSMGIADYRGDIKNKQQLIERADQALYRAKKDGRNLIRLWKDLDYSDEAMIDRYGVLDLQDKFAHLSDQMRATYLESTNALIKAVDAKDPYAQEHSQKVSHYAVELGKALNLTAAELEVIRYAALLHDIGKISIKQEILIKKGKLTKKEHESLKRHPIVGVNILKEVKFLEKEIPLILHHHEWHDGTGYPHGLKDREIPLGARIISIADAFDAMTSGRTYKGKLSRKEAVRELKRGSGTQFSPELVSVFVKLVESNKV